jgi:hypothetical protein
LVPHIDRETLVVVFKNRVLWKTLEPKGDEVTGKWRNVPIKELHEQNFSSNKIQVMKSRRI